MPGILESWLKDLPQQFQDKKMITALLRSYSRQLEELKQVFYVLDNKTDIDSASGAVLDHVGTIPALTRKEAGLLAGHGVDGKVMTDDLYRQYLKYKVLLNTSDCTYHDLMEGMNYIYNTEKLHYREEKNYPATIFFDADNMKLDEADIEFHRNLCIKADGVDVLLKKNFLDDFMVQIIEILQRIVFSSKVYPRLNIPYLRYNGRAKYNGRYRYNGYMSDKRIDLYPTRLNVSNDVKPFAIYVPKIIYSDAGITHKADYVSKYTAGSSFDAQPKYKMDMSLNSSVQAMPTYVTKLTTHHHITKYNGTRRYDGSRKYDAKIIEEVL